MGCRAHFDPLANDAATGTTDATDATMLDGPTTCAAVGVPTTGRFSGTLVATTGDDHGSCGGVGFTESAYFIDVPAGTDVLATADEANTIADTTMYIRTSCTAPASEVLCDSAGGRGDYAAYHAITPSPGRYYVFMDGENTGPWDGRIQVLLPVGAACDLASGREVCNAGLACVGNVCAAAACVIADTLMGATSYTRTTNTMTSTSVFAGTCGEANDGGLRSPETIYQLILASSVSNVHVTTDDPMTNYDTLVYMRQGSCAGAQVACDDDGAAAGASQFDTGALSAGMYFLFVDGFAGRSGTAKVVVTITP